MGCWESNPGLRARHKSYRGAITPAPYSSGFITYCKFQQNLVYVLLKGHGYFYINCIKFLLQSRPERTNIERESYVLLHAFSIFYLWVNSLDYLSNENKPLDKIKKHMNWNVSIDCDEGILALCVWAWFGNIIPESL